MGEREDGLHEPQQVPTLRSHSPVRLSSFRDHRRRRRTTRMNGSGRGREQEGSSRRRHPLWDEDLGEKPFACARTTTSLLRNGWACVLRRAEAEEELYRVLFEKERGRGSKLGGSRRSGGSMRGSERSTMGEEEEEKGGGEEEHGVVTLQLRHQRRTRPIFTSTIEDTLGAPLYDLCRPLILSQVSVSLSLSLSLSSSPFYFFFFSLSFFFSTYFQKRKS